MDSGMIRIGIIVAGVLLMSVSFWTYSYKRIAVNFAVIWEILGLALILTGAVPVLSGWIHMIAPGTRFVFFAIAVLVLFLGFQSTIMISQLAMKVRELTMQVSLLNQENEHIMAELDEVAREVEESHEKDIVCG